MNFEFYYAKLNFTLGLFSEPLDDKYKLLLDGLTVKKIVTNRNRQFIFGNIEGFDIEGRKYFYGIIIKYADIGEETVNIEKQKTEEQVVEDKVIAKSHFIIDLQENIVLYTEVKSHISKSSFLEIFSDLLSVGLKEKNIEVLLIPITDKYDFLERLKTLSKIIALKLIIFPTNPFPDDIIREIDEKLKRQGVKRKTIIYKAKSIGLQLDEDIQRETVYTDIGYGKGVGVGEEERGKIRKVYSQRSEKQRKTPPISLNRGISGLIEDIDNLFKGY